MVELRQGEGRLRWGLWADGVPLPQTEKPCRVCKLWASLLLRLAKVCSSATHQDCSLHSMCTEYFVKEQNKDNSFCSYCVFDFLDSGLSIGYQGLAAVKEEFDGTLQIVSPSSESLNGVSVCVSLTPLASGPLQPSSDTAFIRRAASSRDSKQTN